MADRILKSARRADRFSKMSMLAAWDAVGEATVKIEDADKKYLGIILVTSFGPHNTTFRFIDDILTYGQNNVSPTVFSHSVHNAAVSYIASLFKSHGPTCTFSMFSFSLHQAFITAGTWLKNALCKHVLVVCVDECGDVFNRVVEERDPHAVAGEGCVCFLLTKETVAKRLCVISEVAFDKTFYKKDMYDMVIVDTDGMCVHGKEKRFTTRHDMRYGVYSLLFGTTKVQSAFNCAVGALSLKNQMQYASFIRKGGDSAYTYDVTKSAKVGKVACLTSRTGIIGLEK